MSNKKTFFVKVNEKGEIDKQSAKEFADFLGEETKPVKKSLREEPSKVDIAETVFGMFDQLEEEIESRKTPIVEEEEKPISFTTQKEVDGFNELSEILHSDDVAGTRSNVTISFNLNTTSSSATFATPSLPLVPEGYVSVVINGATKKIPYYGV